MTIGKLKYTCVKCRKKITISILPDLTDRQHELIGKLFDKKICINCYKEKKNEN